MMTTMAALLGALPLALGLGDGAELRQPLGIAIVGGLIVSQILTLTPRRSSTSISTASVGATATRPRRSRPRHGRVAGPA